MHYSCTRITDEPSQAYLEFVMVVATSLACVPSTESSPKSSAQGLRAVMRLNLISPMENPRFMSGITTAPCATAHTREGAQEEVPGSSSIAHAALIEDSQQGWLRKVHISTLQVAPKPSLAP